MKDSYIDNGTPVGKKCACPNCGSDEYLQTVSTESCSKCGLRFDYWGGGGNDVYTRYTEEAWREQQLKEWNEDRDRKEQEMDEWYRSQG